MSITKFPLPTKTLEGLITYFLVKSFSDVPGISPDGTGQALYWIFPRFKWNSPL